MFYFNVFLWIFFFLESTKEWIVHKFCVKRVIKRAFNLSTEKKFPVATLKLLDIKNSQLFVKFSRRDKKPPTLVLSRYNGTFPPTNWNLNYLHILSIFFGCQCRC